MTNLDGLRDSIVTLRRDFTVLSARLSALEQGTIPPLVPVNVGYSGDSSAPPSPPAVTEEELVRCVAQAIAIADIEGGSRLDQARAALRVVDLHFRREARGTR